MTKLRDLFWMSIALITLIGIGLVETFLGVEMGGENNE